MGKSHCSMFSTSCLWLSSIFCFCLISVTSKAAFSGQAFSVNLLHHRVYITYTRFQLHLSLNGSQSPNSVLTCCLFSQIIQAPIIRNWVFSPPLLQNRKTNPVSLFCWEAHTLQSHQASSPSCLHALTFFSETITVFTLLHLLNIPYLGQVSPPILTQSVLYNKAVETILSALPLFKVEASSLLAPLFFP